MSLQKSMWYGKPDRLERARTAAQDSPTSISAHSVMLSAYISILNGQSLLVSSFYTLLALWHASLLTLNWEKLSHNQLDVLIQFWLRFRSNLPFIKDGRALRVRWYPQPNRFLLFLAKREVELTEHTGAKPHQRALAYLTYAETIYAVDFRRGIIEEYIAKALHLEAAIRNEDEDLLALRQLVRILRKVGELYSNDAFSAGGHNTRPAEIYLERALFLASEEADTPDQAKKIRALLRSLA